MLNTNLKILYSLFNPVCISRVFASGRWYPQPMMSSKPIVLFGFRPFSSEVSSNDETLSGTINSDSSLSDSIPIPVSNAEPPLSTTDMKGTPVFKKEVCLKKVLPTFAKPRGLGRKVYGLVPWKNDEQLADYVLFEDSMQKSKVSWLSFSALTTEEKSIYVGHMKAIRDRKLKYICPQTGKLVETVSQLLYYGECCGKGCRHCPYELENCDPSIKKSLAWNSAYYV